MMGKTSIGNQIWKVISSRAIDTVLIQCTINNVWWYIWALDWFQVPSFCYPFTKLQTNFPRLTQMLTIQMCSSVCLIKNINIGICFWSIRLGGLVVSKLKWQMPTLLTHVWVVFVKLSTIADKWNAWQIFQEGSFLPQNATESNLKASPSKFLLTSHSFPRHLFLLINIVLLLQFL